MAAFQSAKFGSQDSLSTLQPYPDYSICTLTDQLSVLDMPHQRRLRHPARARVTNATNPVNAPSRLDEIFLNE